MIEDTELLLSQANTADAVVATFQIESKRAVVTIVRVIETHAAVEMLAGDRVVDQLREVNGVAVEEVTALETITVAVVAVLQFPAAGNEVAVLPEGKIMRILAVLAPNPVVVHHRNLRYRLHQRSKLRVERLVQVDVSPIRQGIEVVTPPTGKTIDGIWCIGRMDRDDGFTATAASTTLERMFSAPDHPALETAFRAKRRRMNCILLPAEDRRNLVVEREIIVGDLKRCLAVATRSLHGRSVYLFQITFLAVDNLRTFGSIGCLD